MGQARLRKAEILMLKAGPEYFYHGTTAQAAEEIVAAGFLDPARAVKNKQGVQAVMVTDSLEAAVNITAVRKTQDLDQEIVVFKIHKSKLDKSKTFASTGTKQISIMRGFKGWAHLGPVDIRDAEVARAKPTFKLPQGVDFVRSGNKTGFVIQEGLDPATFAKAWQFAAGGES